MDKLKYYLVKAGLLVCFILLYAPITPILAVHLILKLIDIILSWSIVIVESLTLRYENTVNFKWLRVAVHNHKMKGAILKRKSNNG